LNITPDSKLKFHHITGRSKVSLFILVHKIHYYYICYPRSC